MEKLKFLIDVGVGRNVEQVLIEGGYDVHAVRDIDPSIRDVDILEVAASENRMIITMDKDFGELVYHSGKVHAGVMILRLEEADGKRKAAIVKRILRDHADKMLNRFCVYQDGRLRIRG